MSVRRLQLDQSQEDVLSAHVILEILYLNKSLIFKYPIKINMIRGIHGDNLQSK